MDTAFGPWLVDAILGRGGMGVVWRAHHAVTGRRAAVKTVRVETPAMLAGFGREIEALSRVSHPGIVALLDHGVDDGRPWFAMELVEGVSLLAAHGTATSDGLFTYVDEPGPVTAVELDRGALVALRRLCDALAALHGAGLVHRDLKPDNVIVRPDGVPVLVDFGIAVVSRRREVVDVRREVAGTRGYMAPEQRRGDVVDARADLYALGRMIEDVGAREPRLEALVAALVTDDPRDRIGHVDEVAAALDAVLGADGPPVVSAPVLFRPALAGRAAERATLAEALGRPGVTVVRGEPGSGKTRLVLEVLRPLARGGLTVVQGVTMPSSGGRAERFAATEAELAALGRAVVVIDDLQWADELTAAFVEHLSTRPTPLTLVAAVRSGERNDAVERILRGGAARVVDLGPLDPEAVRSIAEDILSTRELPQPIAAALSTTGGSPLWVGEIVRTALDEGRLVRREGRWSADALPTCEDVRGWAARRVAALPEGARDVLAAAAVTGRTVDTDLIARMGIDAGEAIREGVRRQLLEDAGDRLLFSHDALREAVLAALAPERRRELHARAAEAVGDDDPGRVASLWAQAGDAARALPLLERAADAAFDRGALLEAEASRREWLRLAAFDHPRRHVVICRLAWVLRRQGRVSDALALGEEARSAADAAGDLEHVIRSLTLIGACHLQSGRPIEAAAAFETVVAIAGDEEPAAAAAAFGNLGMALQAQGRIAEARQAHERALALNNRLGNRRLVGASRMELANITYAEGGVSEEARRHYREAIDILREAGERHLAAVALGNLGDMEVQGGNVSEGLAILEAALALKRELGDRRGEGFTVASIALGRAKLGEFAEARRMSDVAWSLSAEIREHRHLAEVESDRGHIERLAGDLDAAARWVDASLARLHALPDRMSLGVVAAQRALLARLRGEDAEPWLAVARAQALEPGVHAAEVARAIAEAEAVTR